MNLLCRLGLHKWALYSRNRLRYCLRCRREQHRAFLDINGVSKQTWKDVR